MKNIKAKKLTALVLSVIMLVSLIVPGTNLSAVAAEPNSFPAPTMIENPMLLKEFPTPTASIPVDFSDVYTLPSSVKGSAVSGAPEIATITEQAAPNDSISIYGTNLKDASVYAYGLKGGTGVIKKLAQTLNKDGFINAVISQDFDYGMYIIWVQGVDGKVSAPVRVNAPKLTHLSAAKASQNVELRIYGKFLTTDNSDDVDAKTYVYLTNGSSYYKATVLEATPYRVKIKLPTGLTDGETYKIWLHNGHGGDYGWSNLLDIQYKADAEDFWTGVKHTVKVTNGMSSDEEIIAAINNANAGDTIYLPAGVYEINDQIKINKSVKFEGESKDSTVFVCVFAEQRVSNNSLVYGDVYTNPSGTAAFEIYSAPCEFTGITFTEYVDGGLYSAGITKPTTYHIDYAHGMFIRGKDTNDTGVSGQFKVDNCNFKIQRTHSDAQCAYYGSSEQQSLHSGFEKKYKNYSRTNIASAPLWIATDRTEISNCYFESPKEVFTDIMHDGYIHDNTFVGTWVIAGNSGPAAIHNNDSVNMDISNNRIYGKDEETDPEGYVQTGDQTYARTIVFQKSWNEGKNIYVMDNDISRVGELNYNSGEHILFEEVGVTYIGNVDLSDNNMTLSLKDAHLEKWRGTHQFAGFITDNYGNIKLGHTREVIGQLVMIANGKGQGQWRTITEANSGVVTIDRPWDVQPDADSTFVVVPAFANCVVYGNQIEGPELYYKNYNSTNGVNAYASMASTVIDRNAFSQMQAGIAINPQYNMNSYTYNGESVKVDYNFVMYTELLVMNNTIKNTRYGVWNFPSLTMPSMDASSAEADLELQLCSIIRGNDVSGQRRLTGGADTNNTVTTALAKRGGVAIVVGRDYWDPSQTLSTRYWMKNIIVENNSLSNVENNGGNGFIDVSFSQIDTVIRNNLFDGEERETYEEVEVERNETQHYSGYMPKPPIYIPSSAQPEHDGGTEADGMLQDDSLAPCKRLANYDFLEGLKYWSDIDGTKYASTNTSVSNSIATIAKGSGNGIKSAAFKIPKADLSTANSENRVAFVVKYTGSTTDFYLELYVNGVSRGKTGSYTYSSGKLKMFYYDSVYWNINDTYHLVVKSTTSSEDVSIDYIDIARCQTKNAILDLMNGRVYNSTGDITDQTANDTINNNFTNVEFEAGIDQWEKASHFGSATASNGIVTLASSKLQSDYFKVDLNTGDKLGIIYKCTSATGAKVSLLRKDVKSDGTITDTAVLNDISISYTGLQLTNFVNYTAKSDVDSYLSIVIEGTVDLDYISLVTQSGIDINLVYTDIISGKRYLYDMRDPDGTEAEGFEKLEQRYGNYEAYAINDTLMNGDFSEGLKYWSAAINSRTTATMTGNAADSGSVQNGVATVTPSSGGGRGISSAHFRVPNADKHGQFIVKFDYAHTVGSISGLTGGWVDYAEDYYNQFKVEIFDSTHSSVAMEFFYGTNGIWETGYIIVDIVDPDDYYVISIEGFNIRSQIKLKDIKLLFIDDGGEVDFVGVDGSLVGYEYGDVNKDGEVNLLDYARMVKFMAGVKGTTMYKAAGNLDKDANITVDANDLTYLKEYLVSGNKNF